MIIYSHKTIIEGGGLPPKRVLKHRLLGAELALALPEFHFYWRTVQSGNQNIIISAEISQVPKKPNLKILLLKGTNLGDRVLRFIEFIAPLEGVLQHGKVRPSHHECRRIFFRDLRLYYFRCRCYHWLLGLLCCCAGLLRHGLEYFRVNTHWGQVLIALPCESHALFLLSLKR